MTGRFPWLVAAVVIVASIFSCEARAEAWLRAGETLTGRFAQDRHLAGLAAPLHSEGRFVLAAGKGLIWHSETPFDMVVVLTPTGLLQLVDGVETQRLAVARVPFLDRLYEMLGGALAGDWSGMAKGFSVSREGSALAWIVALKPLHSDDPAVAQLQSVTITGGEFVSSVEIRRDNGDWEHLDFSGQTRSAIPLSADDARLIESVVQ